MPRDGRSRRAQVRDKAAWAKVIAQGQAVAVDHAIKGIRAMPPEGGQRGPRQRRGRARRRVHGEQRGAGWKEPAVVKPSRSPRAASATARKWSRRHAASATRPARAARRRSATARRGATVAKRGYKTVLQSALKGHAGMPARGGMANLSDAEIGRAVEYMMNSGAGAAGRRDGRRGYRRPAPRRHPRPRRSPTARRSTRRRASVCHGAGVAGAPKFGDKAAWAPRLADWRRHARTDRARGQGCDARRRAATRRCRTPT